MDNRRQLKLKFGLTLDSFWSYCPLEIDEGRLKTKLYNNKNYFNFPIVNFHFQRVDDATEPRVPRG
jgi:hypothetical protein